MLTWFEVAVKFEKTADEGKVVKVSEKYLVGGLSFTDVESRIIKELEPFISGEFQVSAIKRYRLHELFKNENGDKWFKAKVVYVTFDEEKQMERKRPAAIIAQACDLKEAREVIVEGMRNSMADYEIESISETKIIDIFVYEVE